MGAGHGHRVLAKPAFPHRRVQLSGPRVEGQGEAPRALGVGRVASGHRDHVHQRVGKSVLDPRGLELGQESVHASSPAGERVHAFGYLQEDARLKSHVPAVGRRVREDLGMAHGEPQGPVASARLAQHPFLPGAIARVQVRDQFLDQVGLIEAHGGGVHVLAPPVEGEAVGDDEDHRRGLAACDEAVEALDGVLLPRMLGRGRTRGPGEARQVVEDGERAQGLAEVLRGKIDWDLAQARVAQRIPLERHAADRLQHDLS